MIVTLPPVAITGALPYFNGAIPASFKRAYTVTRYDQALPLFGIGIAIAQTPLRLCLFGAALFVAGVLSGSFVSDWLATALSEHPGMAGYVFLIGPVSCVIVGITLAVPRLIRALLVPPTAIMSGITLGIVVSFNDPTVAQWYYAAGAVLAGLWLVFTPLLTWRYFERPWLAIPGRIFGSWLIAIGVMLGGLQLIPRPVPPPPPTPAAVRQTSQALRSPWSPLLRRLANRKPIHLDCPMPCSNSGRKGPLGNHPSQLGFFTDRDGRGGQAH